MKGKFWLITAAAAILLSACGAPAATPQTIVEKVTVVETVVVEGQSKEVVKEVEKVVTATPEATANPYDPNAPIVVWIDETRKATVDAFKKKYPEKAALIKEELVDRGQFPAKVLLFNNTGKGWPDVVFAEPDIVSRVADASRDFPLDLNPWLKGKNIVENFAPGSLEPCTFGGKLFCLRNDLAQNVTYYNKPLMDQFGYKVPQTWEDFEALGEAVAKDHPGYVLGSIDEFMLGLAYLPAGRCPMGHVVEDNTLYINMQDERCLRVVRLLDKLIAAGVIAKIGPFDPAMAKIANENKLLMIHAASWFGEYIFGGKQDSLYYKTAEGQLGVALPPKWGNEDKAYTGFQGGSAWTVSKHTVNPELAVEFAIFASTATEYHGTGPTFPAYLPAAKEWRKTLSGNKLYAEDPYPVMEEAAGLMDPLIAALRFDPREQIKKTLVQAVAKGETLESAMGELQKELVNAAEAQGYLVKTSK